MDQTNPPRSGRAPALLLLPLTLALAAGSALAQSAPPAPTPATEPQPAATRELTRTGDSRAGSRTMRISLPNGRFILREGSWIRDARPTAPGAAGTPGTPVSTVKPTARDAATASRSFSLTLPSNLTLTRQSTTTHPGAKGPAGPATDMPSQAAPAAANPHGAKHNPQQPAHDVKQHSAGDQKPAAIDKKPGAPSDRKPAPDPAVRSPTPARSSAIHGKPASPNSIGTSRAKR